MTAESHALTLEEWRAEGVRRFGPDGSDWRFVCPACGHRATTADWVSAGASEGAIAFSCVGRWMPSARDAFAPGPGPCTYAGGGLIGLNPITVISPDGKSHRLFAFAEVS